MSAGSSTAPGGYFAGDEPAGEQFPVVDRRSPAEVAEWLQQEGYCVRWSIKAQGGRPGDVRRGQAESGGFHE